MRRMGILAIGVIAGVGAWADISVDRRVDADSDGEVSIELISGTIDVSGWDRDEVEVRGTMGEDVKRLEIDADGDETKIEVVLPDKSDRPRNAQLWARLQIRVPANSRLAIEVISAPITIESVRGERIEIESISGPGMPSRPICSWSATPPSAG